MINVQTRAVSALHTAHLDPMTGLGMLVLPSPDNDVWLNTVTRGSMARSISLNGADWDSAVRALDRLGWEPLLDDDECWIEEGETPQGNLLVALIASESVIEHPTLQHLADARTALLRAVGHASA